MYSVEVATDKNTVKEFLTDPILFPLISDDYTSSPEDWEPSWDQSTFYLLVKRGSELVAVQTSRAVTGSCFEVHVNVCPMNWRESVEINKACIDWVYENTLAMKLIAYIPEYCEEVLYHALKMGFKKECFLEDSVVKNETVHGQWLVSHEKQF